MGALNEFLQTKGIYTLVMILFFLGVYGMVLSKNYMKKLMAMNVMQVAVIFFFLCLGKKEGGMIPIFDPAVTDAASYINPLPHCLMLTAIVVSLGTTGVAIALLMRIKEVYGSVEEVEVIRGPANDPALSCTDRAAPLTAALLCLLFSKFNKNLGSWLVIGSIAGSLACSLQVLHQTLTSGEAIHYWMGNWEPPLGIEFVIDPLSAVMAVLITFISLMVAVYSKPFML